MPAGLAMDRGGPVGVPPGGCLLQRPGDHLLDVLVGDRPRAAGPRLVGQPLLGVPYTMNQASYDLGRLGPPGPAWPATS